MKKRNAIVIGLTLTCAILYCAGAPSLFPSLQGLKSPEEPAEYTAENLFEYINGAADVFIGYDFQHLYSMNYSGSSGESITADVYVHSDRANGFGIYSQEKPREGEFLAIGTEGYYEEGILNFFQGRHYVKISAFDLGDRDREILSDLAGRISRRIPDKPGFPRILQAFPASNRLPNSERFLRRNFLGHSFLENAFTCDYSFENRKVQPFIIAAESPDAARTMVETYLDFARARDSKITLESNSATFTDPYYRSRGPLTLQWRGAYVWGLFSPDAALSERMTKEIGSALPQGEDND